MDQYQHLDTLNWSEIVITGFTSKELLVDSTKASSPVDGLRVVRLGHVIMGIVHTMKRSALTMRAILKVKSHLPRQMSSTAV
jgi:hypothetical protein